MGFFDDDHDHGDPFVGYHYKQPHSDVNRKILYISAISFIIVLFLLFALYLYCRCLLKRRSSHRAAIHRLTFAAIHVSDADADPNAAHRRAHPLNAGLDPAIIASLPTFTVAAKALDSAAVDCAVCLSALQGEEKAKLLPNCNHFFHVGCIDTWLKSHITCPLCRAEVKPRLQPQHREGVHGPVVPLALDDGESSSKTNDSISRLSSFKRMLSKERSSTRILPSGHDDEVGGINHDQDLERQ